MSTRRLLANSTGDGCEALHPGPPAVEFALQGLRRAIDGSFERRYPVNLVKVREPRRRGPEGVAAHEQQAHCRSQGDLADHAEGTTVVRRVVVDAIRAQRLPDGPA